MKEWALDRQVVTSAAGKVLAFETLVKTAAAAATANGSTVSRISIPEGLFEAALWCNIAGNANTAATTIKAPALIPTPATAPATAGGGGGGGGGSGDDGIVLEPVFVPGKSLEQQSNAGPLGSDVWIDHGKY